MGDTRHFKEENKSFFFFFSPTLYTPFAPAAFGDEKQKKENPLQKCARKLKKAKKKKGFYIRKVARKMELKEEEMQNWKRKMEMEMEMELETQMQRTPIYFLLNC